MRFFFTKYHFKYLFYDCVRKIHKVIATSLCLESLPPLFHAFSALPRRWLGAIIPSMYCIESTDSTLFYGCYSRIYLTIRSRPLERLHKQSLPDRYATIFFTSSFSNKRGLDYPRYYYCYWQYRSYNINIKLILIILIEVVYYIIMFIGCRHLPTCLPLILLIENSREKK